MILLGTMLDVPFQVTLEDLHSSMVPPSPECEVCGGTGYQVATHIGQTHSFSLICDGCRSEYPLTEEVNV